MTARWGGAAAAALMAVMTPSVTFSAEDFGWATRARGMPQDPPPPAPPVVPVAPQRRDINPYDRDVPITVPLTFNRRVLGELPVLLTRDDRFLVDARGFQTLISPLLTPDAQTELAGRLAGIDQFPSEELNAAGITLEYDPEQLAVLVLRIEPTRRSVEQLFSAGQPEEPGLPPGNWNAYLNSNVAVQSRESTGDVEAPSVFLNGAMRYKSLVFEADVQGREDLTTGEYDVTRRFARFVYDQPEAYRRWFVGDLDPETRGRQGFVELGGIGVDRRRDRFDSFRSSVLSAARSLVLQQDATVRVLRNGVLYEEFQLDAGQYDLSQLPLNVGSNNVELEIQNLNGLVERVSYSAYLDPIDLEPGDYEYGAYLGVTSDGFFGDRDYSDGELAFTGFWRKAFLNRPALGVGLQLSEEVQGVSGQTQFVLANGAQVQFDAAASNAEDVGYAFAVGYNQFIDRAGTSDSFSVIADYTSEDFATLGTGQFENPISWTVSANYSRVFSPELIVSASTAYQFSRSDALDDSLTANVIANYRFSPQWSAQVGVEYVDFGSSFGGRSDGFGATFALVWQPRFDRRADARYSTARNSGSVSYRQSADNRVGAIGYGVTASYDDGPVSLSGQADYIGNRFDASVAHVAFGNDFGDITDEQITTVRFGTSIATAGGRVAVGRPIFDSFALLYPHPSLQGRRVVVGDTLEGGRYYASSGALGPAVANSLSSYANQTIVYDVEDVPPGYNIGEGIARLRPTYRSGYAIEVGSAAFVSALGRIVGNENRPLALVSGRIVPVDAPETEPLLFFTNSVGRFAIQDLEPGRRYLVTLFTNPGVTFEFTVPEDNAGLLDLSVITVPVDVVDP